MAGTLVKSVMLKITASDGDTEAKLDAISAKAKELAAEHPDLQVKVDSAAAMAKLTVLRREMRATADDADGDSNSLGSRLRGLGGAVASITGVGDAMTLASGDSSMFQKVMAGASLATGLLEPVAAGAIVAVGGLAAGVVAAGAGLGVFGLVAKSAVTDVENANKAGTKLTGGLGDLQRGLASATKEWNGFVSSNASGVAKVMSQGIGLLPKLLSSIQPLLAPVEKALSGLVSQLGKGLDSSGFKSFMASLAANTGPAITKLGTAIGHIVTGVEGIVKAFMPMSQTVLGGLDKITSKFATWGSTLTSHSGFKSLMSMFKSETPMALKTLENLATAIINIGKAMTGMDGVGNSKTLLQVLTPLSGVLAKLSKNPDLDRIALYLLAGADAGKKLSNTFKGISNGLTTIKSGASGLKSAATTIKDFGLGSKIASGATKIWAGIQAGFNIIMDANPIVLVVIAIVALVAIIVLAYIHFKTFRDIVNDVGRALKTGFIDAVHAVEVAAKAVASFVVSAWNGIWNTTKTVWNGIKTAVSTAISAVETGVKTAVNAVVSVVKGAWDDVKSATNTVWGWIKSFINTEVSGVKNILAWFGQLGSLFEGWWNKGLSAVKSVAGNLVSFVGGIPGKIVSALGNVGSMLYNAGAKIIQGLINGIKSMVGSVGSAISSIAGEITSHLPFSPAKKGPLSGSGSPDISGRKIGQMLASGIDSSTGAVTASAHRMAGAAAITGGAASAASMASSVNGMSLQVQGGGGSQFNQFMATWIKNYVRVNFGGNVQQAFGH